MSIIQEALKKIGTPGSERTNKSESDNISGKKPLSADKHTRASGGESGPKFVYYAIIIILLLLLIGIVARASYSPSPGAPSPARDAKKIMPSIERLAEQPPSKRREENIGGFVLNGIMFLVDGPRAIINDIMVGEGETVGGAKVAKIKKDKVVLEYKESEVYLDINK
jgi:hypothetical protein